MDIEFNEDKFRQLILYVAQQCNEHPFFGATKLNKILFFSDFIAYEKLGIPITGAEYTALEYGPGPRRLLPIRQDMQIDGDIVVQEWGNQQRGGALRSPNLGSFSPDERNIIDTVIKALEYQDAESVSELSHKFMGWKAALAAFFVTGQATIIPYETIHVSNKPLSESEVADGRALAEQHGWSFR